MKLRKFSLFKGNAQIPLFQWILHSSRSFVIPLLFLLRTLTLVQIPSRSLALPISRPSFPYSPTSPQLLSPPSSLSPTSFPSPLPPLPPLAMASADALTTATTACRRSLSSATPSYAPPLPAPLSLTLASSTPYAIPALSSPRPSSGRRIPSSSPSLPPMPTFAFLSIPSSGTSAPTSSTRIAPRS